MEARCALYELRTKPFLNN